jgi:hypothetical protein
MRGREFIGGPAGASWPLAARAQRARTPTIGFLNSASHETYASLISAFVQGLFYPYRLAPPRAGLFRLSAGFLDTRSP